MDADKAQIAEVLIRYATGIDFKDWPLLRTCWTDDVDVDYGEVGQFSGVDAITDLMRQLHDEHGPDVSPAVEPRDQRRWGPRDGAVIRPRRAPGDSGRSRQLG